jgi:hypothetical protein
LTNILVEIGAGFTFGLVTLLGIIIFFVLSNIFVPVAVNTLNTTSQALNVTNNPSPKVIFGWAIAFCAILMLADAFLHGYLGGFGMAIGFFLADILLLGSMNSLLSSVAPGTSISMGVSLFVVFIGAILRPQQQST